MTNFANIKAAEHEIQRLQRLGIAAVLSHEPDNSTWPWVVERSLPFDAHDTRDIPGYNSLKAAWDKPLSCEDPLVEEERRLLSVAQCCRDYVEGKR